MTERKFEAICDKEDVLIFLQESNGRRLTCTQIAKELKVPASTMRILLIAIEGGIRHAIEGGKTRYWVPTAAEIAAAPVAKPAPEWKPLTGYSTMLRDAMTRRG